MSGVVYLWVPGSVALLVPAHGIPGAVDSIPAAVSYFIHGFFICHPVEFLLGLPFLFPINLDLNGRFNQFTQSP